MGSDKSQVIGPHVTKIKYQVIWRHTTCSCSFRKQRPRILLKYHWQRLVGLRLTLSRIQDISSRRTCFNGTLRNPLTCSKSLYVFLTWITLDIEPGSCRWVTQTMSTSTASSTEARVRYKLDYTAYANFF